MIDAYQILSMMNPLTPVSENDFEQLIKEFKGRYLQEMQFEERIALHRNPVEVKHALLRDLADLMGKIQQREEMRDIDQRTYGYVPTKIGELWKADRRLRSLYNAVKQYCLLRNKPFNLIAVHIAEYRSMNNLYRSISRSVSQHYVSKKSKLMPKDFEVETRDNGSVAPYLKVYLKGHADYADVAAHLNKLDSVRTANVTNQISGKKDLTVYPAKAYDIPETQEQVKITLDNYFKGNTVDPQFIEEPVSAVSEKAYYQVIDYIQMLGKNLEAFKWLNEKFDEERYRDYFLPFLNTISKKHSATGESFHSQGKTDILFMNEKGEPVLIAECKLWKGEKLLLDAVDQLLNTYVTWRDEKIAMVIFNRDVKKFSGVIDTATDALTHHPLCARLISKRNDNSFSYSFKNPDDDRKTILLELVLLNFA